MNGHTSWVEVSLSALKHNVAQVRGLVGPAVKIMAVVKADAYGHGAVGASQAFVEAGAECLGVTTLEEGLELRRAGIISPILVFSPLLPDQFAAALMENLEQTLCSLDTVELLSKSAVELGKTARVHVKIDTGMSRLGMPGDFQVSIRRLGDLPGVEISGVYTHFANAGAKDLSSARSQNSLFAEYTKMAESPLWLWHAANSAGMLNLPDAYYDMVRPGTILYGQYPTRFVPRKLDLRDTWQLKTRIAAIQMVAAGAKVGYGSEFTAARVTQSAVLPIGYSDGFGLIPESVARRSAGPLRAIGGRLLHRSGGSHVIIRGTKAPVIGRISMQMCSVDVTDIPGVEVGDEALVPARRTTTSARIPRVYID